MKELQVAVLYLIEAEQPEGAELEKTYGVKGHPTFVLMDPAGVTLDRWAGFSTAGAWIPIFRDAVSDPTPVEDKQARMKARPESKLAARLGRIHETRSEFAESVEMYTQAQKLNRDPLVDYTFDLFEAQAVGFYRAKAFTPEQVAKAADAVLASKQRQPEQVLQVGSIMTAVANRSENKPLMIPYLKAAVASTEGVTDPDLLKQRGQLLVDHALFVAGDKELALKLKRESMPEGWMEQARQLNRFAYWCFENEVNLVEAEALARQGVELAKPGREKAQILDTLAEICNARGGCKDAVSLMELAVKEDPSNEEYAQKLERFQKLLAERK